MCKRVAVAAAAAGSRCYGRSRLTRTRSVSQKNNSRVIIGDIAHLITHPFRCYDGDTTSCTSTSRTKTASVACGSPTALSCAKSRTVGCSSRFCHREPEYCRGNRRGTRYSTSGRRCSDVGVRVLLRGGGSAALVSCGSQQHHAWLFTSTRSGCTECLATADHIYGRVATRRSRQSSRA